MSKVIEALIIKSTIERQRAMKHASILIHESTAVEIKKAMGVDVLDDATITEFFKKNIDFEKYYNRIDQLLKGE